MTGSHPTLTTLIIEALKLKGWTGMVSVEEGGKKRVRLVRGKLILDSGHHEREYDAWARVHMLSQQTEHEQSIWP